MSGIDWRTMSDDEIDAALTERERRKLEGLSRSSPAPWTAKTFMVVDVNGKGVAHCGGYNTAEVNIVNAQLLACGPDGVELAKAVIKYFADGESDLRSDDLIGLAQALLRKAGGGMKYAHEEECIAAGLDPKRINDLARRLSTLAMESKKMGLTIFGGAGSGTLRINDKPHDANSRPLVVAIMSEGHWDGGDGGYGVRGEDGLMRGE